MSTPVRTISLAPRSISRAIASRIASNGSERLGPRACQIEQKVQRWSQPVWIATKLFTCATAEPAATGVMTSFAAKALSLRAFPTTRDTSGIASNDAGSSSAAQPVTRILRDRAVARWARRIAWRVWRTASLVTAQLLTTIQSSPGGRRAGDRLALGEIEAAAERDRLDAHCSASRSSSPSKTWVAAPRMRIGSPGAQVIVSAAAGHVDRDRRLRALRRDCRDRARAGAGAAGAASAPAPRSHVRSFRCRRRRPGDIDVDPFGEGRIVLDPRAELVQRRPRGVGDEEDEVRIADVERQRLLELVPGHRQRGGVHRIGEGDLVPAEARLADGDFDLAALGLRPSTARRRSRSSRRRSAGPRSAWHCRSFRPRRRRGSRCAS